MSYLYGIIVDSLSPEELERVNETLDRFGVDYRGESTELGRGSYKEVHRTNIPGVVAFLTSHHNQLDQEMFILDILAEHGYPVMEYYCVEKIGNLTIALAKHLYPINRSWDEDRQNAIREQVEEWLRCMIEENLFPSDLQFMVDENDQAVFTDPLSLHTNKDHYSDYDGTYFLDASCKDRLVSLYVSVRGRVK